MMNSSYFESPQRAGSVFILNFLGTTGHQKWNKWTPASVTTDDIAATKKSTKSFLDHLASQMDHTVSQRCQIYKLEDVQIKHGETQMN